MTKPLTLLAAGLCCEKPAIVEPFGVPAVPVDKSLLPANIRRRTSLTTRLAVTVATRVCRQAGLEPAAMPSVFASVGGEIQVTDTLCRNLADPEGIVSPTQFHNSVHNTTAGYWTILQGSQEATTAVAAALDDTFAMGLLEAWNQAQLCDKPVLLVCYDERWPQYLAPPTGEAALACALVVAGDVGKGPAITRPRPQKEGDYFSADLSALAKRAPAAASLPLLQAFAAQSSRLNIPLNDTGVRWQTDLLFD
jgi:hypothetical protein